jgi:hypothetical protein
MLTKKNKAFELISGSVRQPLGAGGMVSFHVNNRIITTAERALPGRIAEGDFVRVLVHKEPLLGMVDAVAIQVGEGGELHYIGPKVSLLILGLVMALAVVLSYGSLVWLGLLIAVPVVAVAFFLGLQQMQALHAFEAELNAKRGTVIAAPIGGDLLNAQRSVIREAATALSSPEASIGQNRGA